MDLFSAFLPRRSSDNRQSSSCGDIPDLYISKSISKKRHSDNGALLPPSDRAKSTSNSELVNVVDEQLMEIREKLAAFRDQDTQFRERINLLSNSVGELVSARSSLDSFTPSEYSDLDSLDEASKEKEEFQQQTLGQRTFSDEPPELLRCIPTVRVIGCRDHFNQPFAGCFQMRRATSDPISIHSQIAENAGTTETTQMRSTYSAEAIHRHLYPQYNNPEEISTLF